MALPEIQRGVLFCRHCGPGACCRLNYFQRRELIELLPAHPEQPAVSGSAPGLVETYSAPQGYDDTADHLANFFHAVETREHVTEDEVFGHNAAVACHMANHSYFHHGVAMWDTASQTIKS